MKVYTIQTVAFYEALMQNGVVYCNKESWFSGIYQLQYDWMAEQMRKRVGEPPLQGIKYPIWVWYQYISKKNPVPKMSPKDILEGQTEAVMLELEVPDNEVLLSNFSSWHLPLNHWAICNRSEDKQLRKELGEYEEVHGKCYELHEYPEEIRRKVINTWERVLDLNLYDPYIVAYKRQNSSIQGTIWLLRKEWLKVAHIFNKHSEIKRIIF